MASFLRPSSQLKNTFESRVSPLSMSYTDLHLDAKTAIAHISIAAWNALMRADPVFGRYALSDAGRSAFIAAFTVVANNTWRVGCKYHRIGGPARVCDDGSEAWYALGKLHRVDTPGAPGSGALGISSSDTPGIGGPARTHADGSKEWYVHGKRHRIGGPAVEYADGTKVWYKNGKQHRINGPAITFAIGGEVWYEHGQRHRIGGPARIYADGSAMWFERDRPLELLSRRR